ncbi:DEAD/DEAH box helicase [Protofrankia symbiont of Coriaria ruscifolia]|uniref:DEAD/DEAH box helicase n=1 Tax=Protofrankia symbiont of Coriaria ruscifolia TaxID=1306542 RepID=UPI001A9402B6|nr:DEAD/DEAH box helicase family protein [Protofrankia symbiont of Coriaria ruscifolia]
MRSVSPADPYAIPVVRRESVAPLVPAVRTEVTAWRAGGYPGASKTTQRLLEHWFLEEHETEPGVPFRWYFCQREAIETLIYLHEVVGIRTANEMVLRFRQELAVEPRDFARYVVKMATGSGKTKVMSLAIAWSYFHALREPDSPMSTTSLVTAPNLIVFERLREDFEHARIFRQDPVLPPEWRRDFDLTVCLRHDPIPLAAPGVLLLTNVQALYERPEPKPVNPIDRIVGRRPPKDPAASDPPLRRLAARGRILVVDDEAHHVHDEIQSETREPLKVVQTIQRLNDLAERGVVAQLDFSATPRDQQGRTFPETVVDYPLSQAIEDGIVKRPVIGELSGGPPEEVSDDASVRYRQRIGAGVAKWRDFRKALEPTGRMPLLFVMAEDTTSADQIARHLGTLHDLAGRVLTLHVNLSGRNKGEIKTDELEQARKWAREVDLPDSPYRAIVSVLMLREGWDVRNVSVIVPLRPLTAKANILPEQTLGRGLRRMTPPGSGVDESVVIIDHEAFRNLWDKALDDAEYAGVGRENLDDTGPSGLVVAVEPDRLAHDIGIPLLPRVLSRTTSRLSSLRVEDLPERRLALPDTLRSETIDYRSETIDYIGRDLLSGQEIERAQFPLPHADDPSAVLAWFAHEVQRDTRLTGQFAIIAPLVRGWVERRAFGGPVDFDDPVVLQALTEPSVRESVLAVLREAVDKATLTTSAIGAGEVKELLLSATKPFLWSRDTFSATKSVFNVQPCDNELETRFCAFLDRCGDVESFAKLARQNRFSLEYRGERQRLAYYYPDFVARLVNGDHFLIETKGLADLDVPAKDSRAARWAVDATVASGTRWMYLRIDEEPFRRHEARLGGFLDLVDLVHTLRREKLLASQPPPRRMTKAEAIAAIENARARLEGVTGGDEELDRFREAPRG